TSKKSTNASACPSQKRRRGDEPASLFFMRRLCSGSAALARMAADFIRGLFVSAQQLGPVAGGAAERFPDPRPPGAVGDAVGAAGGAGLDLPRVRRHGDVGDRRVLGLAAAVADDRRVPRAPGQLDRVERLRQGTDLVDLDEDAVAGLLGNALLQALRVG